MHAVFGVLSAITVVVVIDILSDMETVKMGTAMIDLKRVVAVVYAVLVLV